MGWAEIVPYVFGFMALAIAAWVADSIKNMSNSISALKDSVFELNKNVAVIVVRTDEHERRIARLEDGS